MFVLSGVAMLMMCRYAAALVGLKPAWNWLVLLMPVPSGSALGAANGLVVLPKYATCHAWKLLVGEAPALTVIVAVAMFTDNCQLSYTWYRNVSVPLKPG